MKFGVVLVAAALVGLLASGANAQLTPQQISKAYGFSQLSLDGTGQTIAIVDAGAEPTITSDVNTFDTTYGLSALTTSGPSANFSIVGVNNTAAPTATVSNFPTEIALDVEYAHAIAPGAKIVLVEAAAATNNSLYAAAAYAATIPNVSTVSMSFGGSTTGASSFDGNFLHAGVTFIASTGDSGAGTAYPSVSPNVLAVGGTILTTDAAGNYTSETGWSGSGGGVASGEPAATGPSGNDVQTLAQANLLKETKNGVADPIVAGTSRTAPDVAYNAGTGVDVVYNGSVESVGGTSAGAPQWAGLLALVDEDRALNGLGLLSSAQTLADLYGVYGTPLYAEYFHDIIGGSNGFDAIAGYDLNTGLGSPIANALVPYLGTLAVPEPAAVLIAVTFVTLILGRHPRNM